MLRISPGKVGEKGGPRKRALNNLIIGDDLAGICKKGARFG
jgi:hypothetical protein